MHLFDFLNIILSCLVFKLSIFLRIMNFFTKLLTSLNNFLILSNYLLKFFLFPFYLIVCHPFHQIILWQAIYLFFLHHTLPICIKFSFTFLKNCLNLFLLDFIIFLVLNIWILLDLYKAFFVLFLMILIISLARHICFIKRACVVKIFHNGSILKKLAATHLKNILKQVHLRWIKYNKKVLFQKKYQIYKVQIFFKIMPQISIKNSIIIISMGGKQTIIQKHYIQNPQAKRQLSQARAQIGQLFILLKQLQQKNRLALEQAKKLKKPEVYRQLKEKAWNMFLDNLKILKVTQKIPKKNGERNHVLIGNISAGKTSLINFICDTQLPVGVGECTSSIRMVASSGDGKVHIWDSPGDNQDFAIYDPDTLGYYQSADRIFIIYNDSLKSCKQIVQVLYKIKPNNTYLVRSMCDRAEQGQHKTIEEQLQTDRNLLTTWKIKLPVLGTSTRKSLNYLNNQKFNNLLVGDE